MEQWIGSAIQNISDAHYERRIHKIHVKTRREVAAIAHNSSIITEHEAKIITSLLKSHKVRIADIMTPFDGAPKIPVNTKFTPVVVDKLYQTGRKIFPVVDENEQIIGSFQLTDEQLVYTEDKTFGDTMHRNLPLISVETGVLTALENLAKQNADTFLVVDGEKSVGFVTLANLLEVLSL